MEDVFGTFVPSGYCPDDSHILVRSISAHSTASNKQSILQPSQVRLIGYFWYRTVNSRYMKPAGKLAKASRPRMAYDSVQQSELPLKKTE